MQCAATTASCRPVRDHHAHAGRSRRAVSGRAPGCSPSPGSSAASPAKTQGAPCHVAQPDAARTWAARTPAPAQPTRQRPGRAHAEKHSYPLTGKNAGPWCWTVTATPAAALAADAAATSSPVSAQRPTWTTCSLDRTTTWPTCAACAAAATATRQQPRGTLPAESKTPPGGVVGRAPRAARARTAQDFNSTGPAGSSHRHTQRLLCSSRAGVSPQASRLHTTPWGHPLPPQGGPGPGGTARKPAAEFGPTYTRPRARLEGPGVGSSHA